MGAETEGDMAVGGSREVEGIGFGELTGIAIGGGEHHEDEVSFFDPLSSYFGVDGSHSLVAVEGAAVAQKLFDGGFHQLGVLAELILLLGVAAQLQQSGRKQARGGFVSAEEDGDRGAEDFVFGERISFAASVNHEAEHIIFGLVLSFEDAVPEISTEIEEGLLRAQAGFDGGGRGLHELHDAGRPLGEEGHVSHGHAKESGDHMDGQGMREISHDAELSGGQGFREEFIHKALHEIPIASDGRGTEDFVQQSPNAGVAGRIDIDQAMGVMVDQWLEGGELPGIEVLVKQAGDATDVGEALGILQAGAHIVVAGDDPAIPCVGPLHGFCLLQCAVNRKGIGSELGSVDDVVEFHGMEESDLTTKYTKDTKI